MFRHRPASRLIGNYGNMRTMKMVSSAADPIVGHATTTLCLPIDPKVYIFVSSDGLGRAMCNSSSIAIAALLLVDKAQIHPTV